MNNKKTLLFMIIWLLIVVVIIFVSLVAREIQRTKNIPTEQPKIQTKTSGQEKTQGAKETDEDMGKEKPADSSLVNVDNLSGTIISVNSSAVTVNTGEKNEKFSLISVQEGLGVFKKIGNDIAIIGLNEIKSGDKVYLEYRQSDKKVNAMIIEQ